MDVLIKWMKGFLSQSICISQHYNAHFKYFIILFHNCNLNKAKIFLKGKLSENKLQMFLTLVSASPACVRSQKKL